MFECLILRDSTGVGTAPALVARDAIHCDVMAVERARAGQIRGWRQPTERYGTTILAIGYNDSPGTWLFADLVKIRPSITTGRAIGLLPYPRPAAQLVISVAAGFGDESIDLKRFATSDRIHPHRY